MSAVPDEGFRLVPCPAPKRRRPARARAAKSRAEDAAREERAAFLARRFICVNGLDIAFLADPVLDRIELPELMRRLQRAFYEGSDPERLDVAVFQGGRLVGVLRKDRRGKPVAMVFED